MSTQIKGKGNVSFKSAHGKFLVAEPDGNLNANRDQVGSWEQFTILKVGSAGDESPIHYNDVVALRSAHGKYVVAEPDGSANVNRGSVGAWEKWRILNPDNPDATGPVSTEDKVAFRSAHGGYLVAEPDGSANANREAIGAWEQWRVSLSDVVAQPPVRPTTITTAAVAAAAGRVQLDGRRFKLDGQPFRFVGANLREFVFYGHPAFNPAARPEFQPVQLQAMRDMNMRVVRMHACHKGASVQDCIDLLRKALDLVAQFDLLAIVVLNDALKHGEAEFFVPGEDHFHKHQNGHLDKEAYFVDEGYKNNLLPFIESVVPPFKDHAAIFAWELGNEYAIIPQPCRAKDGEAFFKFAKTVSAAIRSHDPNHLISTGLVNTGHVAPNETGEQQARRAEYARTLYALPTMDFATVHFYTDNSEEQSSLLDLNVVHDLHKPLIVEEFGPVASSRDERVSLTRSRMDEWLGNKGVAGFMQWGLMATDQDIAVGDQVRGMDKRFHTESYDGMRAAYADWGGRLRQG